jgi:hypothetical protein
MTSMCGFHSGPARIWLQLCAPPRSGNAPETVYRRLVGGVRSFIYGPPRNREIKSCSVFVSCRSVAISAHVLCASLVLETSLGPRASSSAVAMPKLVKLPEPKVFLRPARHQVLGLYESCQGGSDPSHRGCGGSPPFLAGAGGYLLLPDLLGSFLP